jgi:hypothetical protein
MKVTEPSFDQKARRAEAKKSLPVLPIDMKPLQRVCTENRLTMGFIPCLKTAYPKQNGVGFFAGCLVNLLPAFASYSELRLSMAV